MRNYNSQTAKWMNILNQKSTSDEDLYKLARIFGIRNLRVCYASETDPHYKGPQIVNLDRVGGNGTHWCAYFHNTYFDPLGCPPPPAIEKLKPDYNEIQVQDVRESHCGSYCILYLACAQRNMLAEFFNDSHNHNVIKK